MTAIPAIAVMVALWTALVGWMSDLGTLEVLLRVPVFLCLWVPLRWLRGRDVHAD